GRQPSRPWGGLRGEHRPRGVGGTRRQMSSPYQSPILEHEAVSVYQMIQQILEGQELGDSVYPRTPTLIQVRPPRARTCAVATLEGHQECVGAYTIPSSIGGAEYRSACNSQKSCAWPSASTHIPTARLRHASIRSHGGAVNPLLK